LTKNSPVAFFFSFLDGLLLYNGKRLHIHASMATCMYMIISVWHSDSLDFLLSRGRITQRATLFDDGASGKRQNTKTPRDLYFKTDGWHFLLSVLPCCTSCGRNWLEPCGNDSIIFASRTSFPLSPLIPDAAHRCSAYSLDEPCPVMDWSYRNLYGWLSA
jgi:hypothetical protein